MNDDYFFKHIFLVYAEDKNNLFLPAEPQRTFLYLHQLPLLQHLAFFHKAVEVCSLAKVGNGILI